MENTNKTNTTTVTTNDETTIKHTQISKVVDGKCNNSDFIVLTSNDVSDWIGKIKFNDLNKLSKDKKAFDYPLKSAKKGNEDEGHKAITGKALRKSEEGDLILISVYTQEHGSSWKLNHTHKIKKSMYEAYSLVFSNTEAVLKAEKDNKAPVNFHLNLA